MLPEKVCGIDCELITANLNQVAYNRPNGQVFDVIGQCISGVNPRWGNNICFGYTPFGEQRSGNALHYLILLGIAQAILKLAIHFLRNLSNKSGDMFFSIVRRSFPIIIGRGFCFSVRNRIPHQWIQVSKVRLPREGLAFFGSFFRRRVKEDFAIWI